VIHSRPRVVSSQFRFVPGLVQNAELLTSTRCLLCVPRNDLFLHKNKHPSTNTAVPDAATATTVAETTGSALSSSCGELVSAQPEELNLVLNNKTTVVSTPT
jgi:hypothetical protein